MEKKLQRNETDKMLGGVASGLGEYFDIEITWVRVAFIIATLAGLSGVLIYIILWIVIPVKPFIPLSGPQADYKVYGDKFNDPLNTGANPYNLKTQRPDNGRIIAGILLISVGLYFLTDQFNLLPYWFTFSKLWPLALVIPGVLILFRSQKKDPWEQYKADWDKEEKSKTDSGSDSNTNQL